MIDLLELPNAGNYQLICADPPWSYGLKSPTAAPRKNKSVMASSGAAYYYQTMKTKDICILPVSSLASKDSVLFLWATNPMLPDAFEVMSAWGYKYKTLLTWHKQRCSGMGYWFRGHTEHILFGVRGNVKAFRSLQHNIISLPVEHHSKKPDEFYNIIEKSSKGLSPRLEMFARQPRLGWDSWGDEI